MQSLSFQKTHRGSDYFLQFRKIVLSGPPLESVHLYLPLFLPLFSTVFKAFCVCRFSLLLSLSLSSIGLFPSLQRLPQTVQRNCYSQVIILFVHLHSAVNPHGISLYSLLILPQSSFSCQSQNIAEGEKRDRDKDTEKKDRETRRHIDVVKMVRRRRSVCAVAGIRSEKTEKERETKKGILLLG